MESPCLFRQSRKYKAVQNFIGCDPYEYALKNYSKEYADILNGMLTDELRAVLESCQKNTDKRSIEEYAQDLMLNWMVEDYVMNMLNKRKNIKVVKNGVDANRKFLFIDMVRSNSDFIIKTEREELYVELIVDYSCFWQKNHTCHLRNNKLIRLMEHAKEKRTFLLAVDLINKKFAFIPVNKSVPFKRIESHSAYGGRPVYEIPLNKYRFYDLNSLVS